MMNKTIKMAKLRAIAFGLIAVMIICLVERCGNSMIEAAERPEVLLVYPEATGVSYVTKGPSNELAYYVNVKFPASNVIGWVSSELQKEGWKALPYDFSNPRLPSSNVKGWGEVLYGRDQPGNCAHVWMADWSNSDGDIVHYDFRYEQGRKCTQDASNLRVTARYIPAAAARRARQALDEYMKNLDKH